MRQYNFAINDNDYEVVIKEVTVEDITAEVNGKEYVVKIKDIKDLSKSSSSIPFKPTTPIPAASSPVGNTSTSTLAPSKSASTAASGQDTENAICSPMPGQIISLFVNPGEKVLAGQKVMVLEAMKMENTITSNQEGTVQKIFVKEGDVVNQNQALLNIT